MLKDKAVAATLAVSDLDRAGEFYEQTLGLEPVQENPGGVVYRAGPSFLLVYPSDYAGTNQATGATWAVGDDLDAVVEDLRGMGVTFEHYDLPDTTHEGDIINLADGGVSADGDVDPNDGIPLSGVTCRSTVASRWQSSSAASAVE
jgi:catechol 2,3-dioxygenase-like lactoylglutathione lyase family enzyme